MWDFVYFGAAVLMLFKALLAAILGALFLIQQANAHGSCHYGKNHPEANE